MAALHSFCFSYLVDTGTYLYHYVVVSSHFPSLTNMVSSMDLFDDLILYVAPDKFFIKPLAAPKELMVIDRLSHDVSVQGNVDQISADAIQKPIHGIMGIIRLLSGPYLVVITRKAKIGEIDGRAIWRVEDTEMIPYCKTTLHLNEMQVQDNRIYVSMVQCVLQTPYFYFSYSYDLTHTLQRLHNTTPEFLQMALHERADQRFVWNGHLLRELAQQTELSRYCLPVIHGFVTLHSFTINSKSFTLGLISRRSCFRAGTRYFMRGIDVEGHAANFVETEQIVESNGDMCSFVQSRGSIPLYWSQLPNLKYKPKPVLNPHLNHNEGFLHHMDNQLYNYGKQVLINLIDHKGPEQGLEKAISELVRYSGNPSVKYESFDFHHECRKMRWDRLSILMDRVAQDQEEFSYFMRLRDGNTCSQQEGIFRTNCIDCLDRTNVVQNLLARRSLENQLRRLEILVPGDKMDCHTSLEVAYKNAWADNADICSIQYAGTGALKTDFTRTGKRTHAGLLRDGLNSLVRYYKNNFSDGFRQDAIDLFLGNYVVEDNEGITRPSALRTEKDWKYLALPIILLVAVSMAFVTLVVPTEYTLETMLYFLFWVAMSAVTFLVIMFYGVEFVDQPRLCDATKRKAD